VDRLTHSGRNENIPHGGKTLAPGLATNGLDRLRDARRRRVSVLTVAHGLVHGLDDVRRRLEIEIQRIADVERKDPVSLLHNFIGDAGQVADGVADVIEAGGGSNLVSRADGSHGSLATAKVRGRGSREILNARDALERRNLRPVPASCERGAARLNSGKTYLLELNVNTASSRVWAGPGA